MTILRTRTIMCSPLCTLCILYCTLGPTLSSSAATPARNLISPRITVRGGDASFRDAANRSVLFHGINYVKKESPYVPSATAPGEVDKLRSLGATVVRLGVMLSGVFPGPCGATAPNMTYLRLIREQVDTLWTEAGIRSVLDLHPDVLNGDRLCGEGVPDWMVNASELGSLNFPLPLSTQNESVPDPATGGWAPKLDCSARGPLKFIGWSSFYMTDASGKTFQQLYDGTSTLAKYVERYWVAVAAYFRGHDGVLAYELLNEPWVGDHVKHPLLLLEAGAAERGGVGTYMKRMHAAVRSVDPDTFTLFAPAEVNNRLMRHVGYEAGFLPGEPMAFHTYCITGTDGPGPTTPLAIGVCHLNDGLQLKHRRDDLQRLATAGIVTEFGAVSDAATGLAEVRYVAEHFDGPGMPLSWIYWNNIPDQDDYRAELARSYPRAVAGDVVSVSFNASNGDFTLVFVPDKEASLPTEVFLSRQHHYPKGWDVTVTPEGCCDVKDVPGGVEVRVGTPPGSSISATVGVRVVAKA
jgi:endoglycosylceramidase